MGIVVAGHAAYMECNTCQVRGGLCADSIQARLKAEKDGWHCSDVSGTATCPACAQAGSESVSVFVHGPT